MKRAVFFFMLSLMLSGCVSLVGPNAYTVREKPRVLKKKPKVKNISEKKENTKSAIGCKKTYKVWGKQYCVLKHSYGFEEVGIASWYGPNFHGKKTASGETYNMYEMTAAHKSLPLGTYVRVKNLETGKSVIVKINDRGPFVPGRVIDLSFSAAKELGVVAKGTAKVKLIALGKKDDGFYTPVDYKKGDFYVQFAAFKEFKNAEKLKKEFEQKVENVKIIQAFGLFRVVVGPELTYVRVMELRDKLKTVYPKVFVIRVN